MKITIKFDAARPNSVGQLVLDYNRPALVGSEKQVAWANDLRQEFEARMIDQALIAYTKQAGLPKAPLIGCVTANDVGHPRVVEHLNAINTLFAPTDAHSQGLADAFAKRADAKWWIEKSKTTQLREFLA